MLSFLLLVLALVSALWLFYKLKIITYKHHDLPKGPGWSIRNLLQVVKNPHGTCSEWVKTYGKIHTIYLGFEPALVIHDATAIRELFSNFASTGKYKTELSVLLSLGPYGLINTEGKESLEERQFFLKALRTFGLGRLALEPLILEEAEELQNWIIEKMLADKKVTLGSVLHKATNNALWTIIPGKRVSFQDTQVADLMEAWITSFQYAMKTGLGFLPWLKYIAPGVSGYNAFYKACSDIHQFVKEKFAEHRKMMVQGSPRDLLDVYNERLNTAKEEGKQNTENNNVATIANMFIAGGKTTAATLNWLIFHLVMNPEAQKKVHEEIDRVIGTKEEPTLANRARMPYVEAVILETLRYSTLFLMGGPHRLLEDLKFREYLLPKGLIIIPNIYHCHKDPEVWSDPDLFQPERFLDADEIIKEENKQNLIPFQAGRRQCIGENLAKDVLFLFAVKLFQKFEVHPDHSVELHNYAEANVGVMQLPKSLPVVIMPRKKY